MQYVLPYNLELINEKDEEKSFTFVNDNPWIIPHLTKTFLLQLPLALPHHTTQPQIRDSQPQN